MFKRASSKAAGEKRPETYPLGYVEDLLEPRTKLGARFNILLVGDFLAAQVYFPYTIVGLYLLDGTFTDDCTFVEHSDDPGDLPNKLHIVFEDDDRPMFRQRLQQATSLFRFPVGHPGDRFIDK
jgi:hypothetical protein